MIDIQLVQKGYNLVVVTFSGAVTQEEADSDYRFGQIIKGLNGAPFRVLCDFTAALTMPKTVADNFLRAQLFAVKRGMQRDAFVTSSAVLRMQFARIARESKRAEALGPLRFFDTIPEAEEYLRG